MNKPTPHAAILSTLTTTLRVNTINGTTSNDSLIGTAGADSIYGAAGNDTLLGNSGNDILDGGIGIDSMAGGSGNDVYNVDSAQDKISESSNSGTDTIKSPIGYALPGNVENLALYGNSSASLIGYGNELNNYLSLKTGYGSLYGFAGNDILEASTSGSTLVGGAGNDTYILHNTPATVAEPGVAEGIDTVVIDKISAYSLKNLSTFENLQFADASNHVGIGNALANQLTGNNGHDNLQGMENNDTLAGGAGNDTLSGGTGNDNLTGGAGDDYFYFSNPPNSGNIETVTDFTSGQDLLWLAGGAFPAVGGVSGTVFTANDDKFYAVAGGVAHDTTDRIIYDTNTGALYYDADGSNAAAPAVQFAMLVGHPALAATDILTL